MDDLTDIQREVFALVQAKLENGKSAPTTREIAAHFGWAAKRAAECHLEALIRKGFLENETGKARSLRLKNWAQTSAR
jgi:repressor LexA